MFINAHLLRVCQVVLGLWGARLQGYQVVLGHAFASFLFQNHEFYLF